MPRLRCCSLGAQEPARSPRGGCEPDRPKCQPSIAAAASKNTNANRRLLFLSRSCYRHYRAHQHPPFLAVHPSAAIYTREFALWCKNNSLRPRGEKCCEGTHLTCQVASLQRRAKHAKRTRRRFGVPCRVVVKTSRFVRATSKQYSEDRGMKQDGRGQQTETRQSTDPF